MAIMLPNLTKVVYDPGKIYIKDYEMEKISNNYMLEVTT